MTQEVLATVSLKVTQGLIFTGLFSSEMPVVGLCRGEMPVCAGEISDCVGEIPDCAGEKMPVCAGEIPDCVGEKILVLCYAKGDFEELHLWRAG